nr:adhesion G-protein coupled receptor G6 isoform X2 [Nothobranchius furzeri]
MMDFYSEGVGGRWRLHPVFWIVLFWISLHRTALGCSSTNCNVVLMEVQGEFTSPCYPQKYPNWQNCKWTIQAPAGFVIELSFLDFEVEEAQGCIYDRVVVNTGSTEVKFCGLTARGLTLNSTGNVMEVSFTSDFSIQKKGFKVSFQHVAVALRNQKVKISDGNGQVIRVSSSVSIPALRELTVCFEVERTAYNQREWLFSYYDTSSNVALSFGSSQTGMKMVVDQVVCPVQSIVSAADFTSTMKPFCLLWRSSSGLVEVFFNRASVSISCSSSTGHTVPAGGVFQLGGQQSFSGNMYNLRLWDRAMTLQELDALTCDTAGNVIDWDNSNWTIPSSLAQTNNTLSCSMNQLTPPGAGAPAADSSSSTSPTNTSQATNAVTHANASISSSAASSASIAASAGISTPEEIHRPPSKAPPSRSKHQAHGLREELTAAGMFYSIIRRFRPASDSSRLGRTIHGCCSITQNPRDSRHQPRPFIQAPWPRSSREPSYPRPLSHRNPRPSLGLISTPLRKRRGGRRPAPTRAMPIRLAVQVTKPTVPLFGLTRDRPPAGNVFLINVSAPLSRPIVVNQPVTPEKFPTTTPDLGTRPGSQASVLPQDPSPWQRKDGLFFGVFMLVRSPLSQQEVERAVALGLNESLRGWSFSVEDFRVYSGKPTGNATSFSCQFLLLITNESLDGAFILDQLSTRMQLVGAGPQVQSSGLSVHLAGNCKEENALDYLWPETRPRTTQYLPCFPNKDQRASRSCLIKLEDYSSVWSPADLTNCTVTAENAAIVAEQLINFTNSNLTKEKVSQAVTKVRELVSLETIDTAMAKTVVHIISNVMSNVNVTSETPLVNKRALKAVERLAQKVTFEGPSINITSKHLALGILALNTSNFNGTSFSAFLPPNSSAPQIGFELTANALAQVTLPPSLLSGVVMSEIERSSLSRINFRFFSSTNLFEKRQKDSFLNSYVVASSVGNFSINDLRDPVKIEISHLTKQVSSGRKCVFWDFSLNGGNGSWNERGCRVAEGTSSKTVCLCDHLTHFGILMDVSQASSRIDSENKKVLTFLSYIGCGVSAVCSAATLLTYVAFEQLRRDYPSKILMNLSTSLLSLNMVFLLDGWLASLDNTQVCLSVAVLLHYFLLTSFTWMGLESVHMYIALVKVFNTYIRRYILKFCIIGWGLPAVLVGIIVTVNKNFYGVLRDGGDPSAKICWIRDASVFYSTCVGYFCLVFLLNVAMFFVVMTQICGRNGKRSNRTLREEVLRNLRSVVSLTFLLGMTWGFALFAWGPVYLAFTYLFTIFNSLQGLFIFIFHCALKENVQKQWRRSLCCGPYRLSDNSDWSKTATNNTKKVSSDNLALSSSSFGSGTFNWTAKAKATLTPFSKRHKNSGKCFSGQSGLVCTSSSSSSDAEPNSSSSSSILPVSQMIDKVKGYCSTRTDNFYKNIIMSDSFVNCTRL